MKVGHIIERINILEGNMKKITIFLLLLFLGGLIIGDMITVELNKESQVLGIDVYKEYAYSKMKFETVFWQVFFERGKLFLIFILLAFTRLKNKLPLIILFVFTFCMGFFTMSNIISLGAVGLFVSMFVFVPQILFYGGVIVCFYMRQNTRSFYQKGKILRDFILFALLILLFVTGCIVEGLMGIHVIPWVIRLSLI